MALGAVQALIVCAGDLMLGVQCVQPALFMLAGVFISFVYVNIIYALGITFKHIGKAIAVILVIVQIPGSSGMYPIMMPGFRGCIPCCPSPTASMPRARPSAACIAWTTCISLLVRASVFCWPVALTIGVFLRPLVLDLDLLLSTASWRQTA